MPLVLDKLLLLMVKPPLIAGTGPRPWWLSCRWSWTSCLTNNSRYRPEALVAFMPLVLDKLPVLLLMGKPPRVAGTDQACSSIDSIRYRYFNRH